MAASSSQRINIRPITISETYPLRHSVLWPQMPLSYVQLPEDETGQHFGAFRVAHEAGLQESQQESQQQLVSIISLFPDPTTITAGGGGVMRFRKFATDPAWQGKGVGSGLLSHTIEAAKEAGATRIWCDARESALGFYRRFGLEAEGEPFLKGDVPYRRMARDLT